MPAVAANSPASSASQTVIIRKAGAEDCSSILRMINALAVFQGVGDRVHASTDILKHDGFGPAPKFEALIAEQDGAPVGLAIFQAIYSSWEGASVLQITDLFVDEAVRGTGVGFKLAHEVAQLALERGCAGLQLNMVHANPSRYSLDRIGFVHQDDLLHYRLDTKSLKQFVESGN
jgi:GNAT superfamily N-acetyltransferase